MSDNYLNSDLLNLAKLIDDLKSKLNHSIDNKLLISESLQLSQELDDLIVQFYKEHSRV